VFVLFVYVGVRFSVSVVVLVMLVLALMLALVVGVGVGVGVGVCVLLNYENYKGSNIRQYAHDVSQTMQLAHPEMPTTTSFVCSACLTIKLAYIYRRKRR
jgi:tetrahydromethanopterin S-methyltransferase subunit E